MKPIFRSAMFGFHKGDVFNFITRQNKQFEAKIAELTEEKERLEADFEEERKSFERDTDEVVALRAALDESRKLLLSVSSAVGGILEEREKIVACADSVKEEGSDILGKLSDMKLRVAEAERIRDKAEKFDQLSGVLSSIFNQGELAPRSLLPSEETVVNEEIGESMASVEALFDLLESLSEQCENLKKLLPEENEND